MVGLKDISNRDYPSISALQKIWLPERAPTFTDSFSDGIANAARILVGNTSLK